LVLNGIACLVGIAGAVLQSQLLESGVIAGGVLFILALAFMIPAYGQIKMERETGPSLR
jgi:hypothetical protein